MALKRIKPKTTTKKTTKPKTVTVKILVGVGEDGETWVPEQNPGKGRVDDLMLDDIQDDHKTPVYVEVTLTKPSPVKPEVV